MLDEEKENQKNMMIALVLIVAVFMVPRFFTAPKNEGVDVPLTVAEEVVPVAEPVQAEPVIQPVKGEILAIENSFVAGSFASNGTKIDALNLTQYRETVEKDSPAVTLLTQNFYTGLFFVHLFTYKVVDIFIEKLHPKAHSLIAGRRNQEYNI